MGKPNKEKKKREQKRLAEKKEPEMRELKKREEHEKFKKGTKIFLLFLAKAILPTILAISVFGVLYAKILPVLQQNEAFCVIGFIGAALLGVGVSLLIYGKNVAKIFTSVGILLTALSCLLMSIPGLVGEYSIVFYYCNVLCAFFLLLFYFIFRSAVESWLRGRKISKTMIKKSKKGAKNYWWYEELHKKFGLSSVYTLNKIFTVFFIIHLAFAVFLGWVDGLMYLSAISFTLLALLTSYMSEFARIRYTIDEFGCSFALWRKNSIGKYTSSVIDFFCSLLPIAISAFLWYIIK